MVETTSSNDSVNSRRFSAGDRVVCTGGKYKGSIVTFVEYLPLMAKVRFEDGEVRRLWPRNMAHYEPEVPVHVSIDRLIAMVESGLRALGSNAVTRETFMIVCDQASRSAFDR
jgi:hypothetical protein